MRGLTIRAQIVGFAFAGVAGFVVDASILYVGLATGLGPFVGRAVSFCCSVWVTWRINRRWTFTAPQGSEQSAWGEWRRYLVAMSGGGLVNYGVYSATVIALYGFPFGPLFAVAVGSLAGMVVNFVGAKLWVFERRGARPGALR